VVRSNIELLAGLLDGRFLVGCLNPPQEGCWGALDVVNGSGVELWGRSGGLFHGRTIVGRERRWKMSNLVNNERIKARVSFLNNLGVAAIVTGVIGPLIIPSSFGFGLVSFMIPGLVMGFFLEYFGQKMLDDLKE
jgi:hypothetical protein